MDALSGLLETSPHAVFVTDEAGKITASNARAEDLVGGDGLAGTDLEALLSWGETGAGPPDLPPADGPQRLGRNGRVAVLTADGSRVPVEVVLDAVDADRGTRVVASVIEAGEPAAGRSDFEASEAELRRAVEISPAPIVVYDGDGVIRYANGAVAELTGLDGPDELLGTSAIEYIHPDEREDSRAAIRRVLEDRARVEGVERRLRTVEGETRHTILSSAPIVYDGEPAAEVVLYDVTELKEREQNLERQNERLDEFASIVSHDLRNPLSILRSSLELAAETGDEEHIERCQRAVDRMERLVDDLLTFARHGETPTETEPVSLEAVAGAAWEAVGSPAATLSVDGAGVIDADPERLQVLLENLLRNAVEHGGTDVSVTVGATADGFYVADDGPGVPADEREEVFESGYSTAEEGTGFGLSIVREIADAHGWEVGLAESEAGGASFEITGV